MKPHYFKQDKPDDDDVLLKVAIDQSYVPKTCLLGGLAVIFTVNIGDNPCWGCKGPRNRCHGKPEANNG